MKHINDYRDIRLPGKVWRRLEGLGDKYDTNPHEILRRAIAVFSYLAGDSEKGPIEEINVHRKNGKIEKIILEE